MAKKSDLQVLSPQPVAADERSPLLVERNDQPPQRPNDDGGLEAQAEQEQREYDAGATVVADEPSTKKLAATMASLWVGTFFAALGNSSSPLLSSNILMKNRCDHCCHVERPDRIIIQLWNAVLLDRFWLPDCQCCFPATVRQTYGHLRPSSWHRICHHLLCWGHADMWTRG